MNLFVLRVFHILSLRELVSILPCQQIGEDYIVTPGKVKESMHDVLS